MADKIRDLRTKQKFVVDDVYIDKYAKHCGIYATGVYFCLCRHADKQQTCFPGKKLISEEIAISERQVSNCLEPLQRFNIIQVNSSWRSHGKSGKYSSNTYTLMDSSVWKPVFELKNNGNRKHDMPTAEHADGTICRSPTAYHDISRRHMVPTKETHKKETQSKVISQISDLLKRFPLTLQDKIKAYCERAQLKNKSKILTDSQKLTIINELCDIRSGCNNDSVFTQALESAISYDAPNKGYVNAVIKDKLTKSTNPRKSKSNHNSTDVDIFIEKRLGRIATADMIKNVLREIDKLDWPKVLDFLNNRYSQDDNKNYYKARKEVEIESRASQSQVSALTSGIGKNV